MNDLRAQTRYLMQCLAPRHGEVILDLGCGTGKELESILRAARSIGVVGLDASVKALAAAKRRLAPYVKRGVAELHLGDAAEDLPFPSRSFHAVLCAELMECLPEAKQHHVLEEIHRILKPGGRVVMEHTDWDTQLWNARDRDLERKLVHAFCDWTQGWMAHSDGWMGRKLDGLIRHSKLFKAVAVRAYVLTNNRYKPGLYGYDRSLDFRTLAKKKVVDSVDARRFLSDLKAQSRRGTYFYSVNRYIVLANKC